MCYPNLIPKGIKYKEKVLKINENEVFLVVKNDFDVKLGEFRGKSYKKVDEPNELPNYIVDDIISEIWSIFQKKIQ